MKGRALVLFALVPAALIALGSAAFAADNNNIGTWKLNVAKSTYSPGPAPQSQTIKIEAWGEDGIKFTSDGVGPDGKPTHTEFQAKYDGKDNPLKGNPNADTIAYKRIDANTIEFVQKLKGKVTLSGRAVVSNDGKTRTLTLTGMDAQGRDVKNVIVYDKQ